MQNEKTTNQPKYWLLLLKLLPLYLGVTILPLIVRVKIYDHHLSDAYWSPNPSTEADSFLYYKGCFLIMIGILALLGILWLWMKKKADLNKYKTNLTILLIFSILLFLSALLSKNPYFVVHGIREHFESIWVWITYFLLFVYALLAIHSQRDWMVLFHGMLISGSCLIVIGVLQFFKADPYRWFLIKRLIASKEYRDSITFNFEPGRVYMSLYNPNYVGMYLALLFPVLLFMLYKVKKRWQKAAIILLCAGAVLCLIGAGAKNGVIALGIELFLFILWMFFHLKERKIKKYLVLSLGGGTVLFLMAAQYTGLPQALQSILQPAETQDKPLQDIKTGQNSVTITYKNHKISLSMDVLDGGYINFFMKDQNGKEISYQVVEGENNSLIPEKAPFDELSIYPCTLPDGKIGFLVKIDGIDWSFTNQIDDKGYYYMTLSEKYVKLKTADLIQWIPENFLSGRGIVWKRTIPLLKNYILLGAGVENFALEYPHNDYVAQYQNESWGLLFTRPHSVYLQIAIEDGVLALFCFLAFYFLYFLQSVKVLWNNHETKNDIKGAGLAIFLSVTGYMASGLVNDSMVVTAPFFWILIGCGIVLNEQIETLSK